MRDLPAFERCYCTGVLRAQVVAAIRRGCVTVDQLRAATGVCSGCATCRPEVEQLLREMRDGGDAREAVPDPD